MIIIMIIIIIHTRLWLSIIVIIHMPAQFWISSFKSLLILAAVVVFPAPCKPAIKMTPGGFVFNGILSLNAEKPNLQNSIELFLLNLADQS